MEDGVRDTGNEEGRVDRYGIAFAILVRNDYLVASVTQAGKFPVRLGGLPVEGIHQRTDSAGRGHGNHSIESAAFRRSHNGDVDHRGFGGLHDDDVRLHNDQARPIRFADADGESVHGKGPELNGVSSRQGISRTGGKVHPVVAEFKGEVGARIEAWLVNVDSSGNGDGTHRGSPTLSGLFDNYGVDHRRGGGNYRNRVHEEIDRAGVGIIVVTIGDARVADDDVVESILQPRKGVVHLEIHPSVYTVLNGPGAAPHFGVDNDHSLVHITHFAGGCQDRVSSGELGYGIDGNRQRVRTTVRGSENDGIRHRHCSCGLAQNDVAHRVYGRPDRRDDGESARQGIRFRQGGQGISGAAYTVEGDDFRPLDYRQSDGGALGTGAVVGHVQCFGVESVGSRLRFGGLVRLGVGSQGGSATRVGKPVDLGPGYGLHAQLGVRLPLTHHLISVADGYAGQHFEHENGRIAQLWNLGVTHFDADGVPAKAIVTREVVAFHPGSGREGRQSITGVTNARSTGAGDDGVYVVAGGFGTVRGNGHFDGIGRDRDEHGDAGSIAQGRLFRITDHEAERIHSRRTAGGDYRAAIGVEGQSGQAGPGTAGSRGLRVVNQGVDDRADGVARPARRQYFGYGIRYGGDHYEHESGIAEFGVLRIADDDAETVAARGHAVAGGNL